MNQEQNPTQTAERQSAGRDVLDVLIIGGGLAGLCLARQLLLNSNKRIMLIDRRALPPKRQKVGEATVQMSGYYYGRVLELEEHLLCEHYMKYNLRFYWKPRGDGSDCFENFGQSYIRKLSNIVTYQLDRNKFEAEVLRRNRENPNFEFHAPVEGLDVRLGEEGPPHAFSFRTDEGEEIAGHADWVVDASGRGKVLTRRLGCAVESPIRHGTTFCWVDGLVDIERLTSLTPRQVRVHPRRSKTGHTPSLLATNHFCGEGFWFWVIPLHYKTSLGLVYARDCIPREQISTPEKMIEWVCREFPMFARDLPQRKVVDFGGYVDYAYDCEKTLSAAHWAMCGEACRFTDPLYSPGGDLISLYNTLITDAILTADQRELEDKVRRYHALARSVYDAYVPSFAVSYETLGDQEAFSLRYVWELTVYFSFYVFPFINDLFTQRAFGVGFLRRFARLGPTNRNLHVFLKAYYDWKKERAAAAGELTGVSAGAGHGGDAAQPVLFDFLECDQLKAAEECFYRVGLAPDEALQVLDEQLANLEELARAIVAHVGAAVTGDRRALSPAFVAGIDLRNLSFDAAAMAARLAACPADPGTPAPAIAQPALERLRRACAPAAPAAPYTPATAAAPALAAVLLAGAEGER
ncbi:MAG TPA: tryptophan 7-halogenase [Thermoanaerobaculia bacterium]|nr:tryptophan 7-halogenase [Thermoanaerobaculia bacterium]